MEELERFETELLELNDMNISVIYEYLKTLNVLKNNIDNKEKTLKQMYEYIKNKAQSMATNNVAMVNDKVVYLWARTYFSKSNEDLGLNQKPVVQNNTKKAEETPTSKVAKQEEVKKDTSKQISILEVLE